MAYEFDDPCHARTYNVSVDDLKRWNGVDEKNLRTGVRLVVEQ